MGPTGCSTARCQELELQPASRGPAFGSQKSGLPRLPFGFLSSVLQTLRLVSPKTALVNRIVRQSIT